MTKSPKINKTTTVFHRLYSYRPFKWRQNVQNSKWKHERQGNGVTAIIDRYDLQFLASISAEISRKTERTRRQKQTVRWWRHFHSLLLLTIALDQSVREKSLSYCKIIFCSLLLNQISTVDAFQGGEKDIIILSCVRTDHIGFIDCDKYVWLLNPVLYILC